MDGSLTVGLEYVDSDACILMSADLQDPPELIPTFLRKWEEGYENICGIVQKRQSIGFMRRFNSRLFYKIAGKLSDGAIPESASNFRLVDRKVYETVRTMTERNRFVRGLFAWVGFKSIGVPMNRPPRFAGVSNANSSVSFIALVPLAFIWFFVGVPFAGFGSVVALILCGLGLQALMIGIVSEYLGLVYEEVKRRPNFVVSEKIGLV